MTLPSLVLRKLKSTEEESTRSHTTSTSNQHPPKATPTMSWYPVLSCSLEDIFPLPSASLLFSSLVDFFHQHTNYYFYSPTSFQISPHFSVPLLERLPQKSFIYIVEIPLLSFSLETILMAFKGIAPTIQLKLLLAKLLETSLLLNPGVSSHSSFCLISQ